MTLTIDFGRVTQNFVTLYDWICHHGGIYPFRTVLVSHGYLYHTLVVSNFLLQSEDRPQEGWNTGTQPRDLLWECNGSPTPGIHSGSVSSLQRPGISHVIPPTPPPPPLPY